MTMIVRVKIKSITNDGKYCLSEIKGLKDGKYINGEYNPKSNSVLFDWNGEKAVLFIGENCILTKKSKYEIDKVNAKDRIIVCD